MNRDSIIILVYFLIFPLLFFLGLLIQYPLLTFGFSLIIIGCILLFHELDKIYGFTDLSCSQCGKTISKKKVNSGKYWVNEINFPNKNFCTKKAVFRNRTN